MVLQQDCALQVLPLQVEQRRTTAKKVPAAQPKGKAQGRGGKKVSRWAVLSLPAAQAVRTPAPQPVWGSLPQHPGCARLRLWLARLAPAPRLQGRRQHREESYRRYVHRVLKQVGGWETSSGAGAGAACRAACPAGAQLQQAQQHCGCLPAARRPSPQQPPVPLPAATHAPTIPPRAGAPRDGHL